MKTSSQQSSQGRQVGSGQSATSYGYSAGKVT
jgi:hypothetical protein